MSNMSYYNFYSSGVGHGDIRILGARDDDVNIQTSAVVALSLVRLRASELSGWFGERHKMDQLRQQNRDIEILMFPTYIWRSGGSCALPIFLALIRLFFGDNKLLPKVAATGELNLMGQIGKVGEIVFKVKAAVKVGAQIILVPKDNQSELDSLSFEGKERVKYVEYITEALQHAVAGGNHCLQC